MTKRFTNSNYSSATCGEGTSGNAFTVELENASANAVAHLAGRGLVLPLNLLALNLINIILLVVLIILGREVRF